MRTEKWLDIPGTEGVYQISNIGRMRSWIQKGCVTKRRKTPIILATPINNNGYRHNNIYVSELNKVKAVRVHRLVGELFVPNPNNYKYLNHKDGNKLNNLDSNLEWCDSAHNNRHALVNGLNIPARGEARAKSDLTEKDVIEIYHSDLATLVLANKYDVGLSAIYDIKRGRSWNHVTGLLCTRKKRAKYSKETQFANL